MDRKSWIVVAASLVVCLVVIIAARSMERDSDTLSQATPAVQMEGGFQTIQADRRIIVHCGTSMRPAAEKLATEFQDRHGIAVQFNFGGSSELLAAIQLGNTGDLYLCHDPYAERLAGLGLLVRYETVGYLEPIIIVPPGNPAGITGIRDLARTGLRVGLPDSRVATAGKLVEKAMSDLGVLQAVRDNVRMEARGHNEIALALLSDQIDAAMVWNFIASHYAGRVETVAPDAAMPETKVTLCLLNYAADAEAAEMFIEMARSPMGREIFRSLGYNRSDTPATQPAGDSDVGH